MVGAGAAELGGQHTLRLTTQTEIEDSLSRLRKASRNKAKSNKAGQVLFQTRAAGLATSEWACKSLMGSARCYLASATRRSFCDGFSLIKQNRKLTTCTTEN